MARPQSLPTALPSLMATFRRVWPYLRKHRALIAASLVALLFNVGFRLLEPWPFKFLIDTVLSPVGRSRVPVPDFVRTLEPRWLLLGAAGAIVLIGVLKAVTEYVNRAGFAVISNRSLAEMRSDLYRHLQRLPLAFFSRNRSGDLIARLMTDITMLRDVAGTAALPLAASALVFVGMWAFMFILQWKLAMAILVTLPAFWIVAARTGKRIHEAARQQRQREAALASAAVESISAIKSVRAMSLEQTFAIEFDAATTSSAKADIRGGRLSARLERSVDVLIAVATALVVGFGAALVLWREMSTGDLIVFLAYLRKAFGPLQDWAKYSARLAKAAAAGERVLHVLDEPATGADAPGAVAVSDRLRGDIRFEDIAFSYDGRRQVLSGLRLHIRPGEVVALVGPSGIGKSTAADLLLRFHNPQAGRVLVDGRDIRDFEQGSYRRQVGVVLQETILFAGTVRQNIACDFDGATQDSIQAAARLARAHEFIGQMPHGYDSNVAERGATLSQGQKQRLAIARAAVRDTPILVLDEPTVGLDETNRRAVIEGLLRLAEGRTTLLITHDLDLAAAATRIEYLDGGRIVESGTHQELLAAEGRYAALVRSAAASRGSAGGEGQDDVEADAHALVG